MGSTEPTSGCWEGRERRKQVDKTSFLDKKDMEGCSVNQTP